MLLTRSCVLDRIMELELIRIEMIKSSESVITIKIHTKCPFGATLPCRCNLVDQFVISEEGITKIPRSVPLIIL